MPRRPDIQGLRAVAVVAVVVNHLTGHPRGGFVGVDVFFVISGYLITGLLLRDVGASNGLGSYLAAFYRRRIRRLLPAGMLVIGATILASSLLLSSARSATVTRDGGWSSIFWANWHFAAVGTNYFTADGPTSPLQHYWSLSVEEQFYVLWPVLLFVVVAAAKARGSVWLRHMIVVGASTVLSALSLWLAFRQSQSGPAAAYFSTFDRAWELGIGAMLAGALPYLRVPAALANLLSLGGLALIAVSLFSVHGGAGFPTPGAVLPCVGAAGVIAAAGSRNGLLTNPVSVWIGDISYSVYLVHFPVIILLEARTSQRDVYFYVTATALLTGLSILLHALVERPVLQSRWLLPSRSRGAARTSGPAGSRRSVVAMVLAGALACALAVAAHDLAPGLGAKESAAYQRIQQAQHATPAPSPVAHHSSVAAPPPPPMPEAQRLTAQITAALAATSYPPLQPSMEDVIAGPQALHPFVFCSLVQLPGASSCTWGDPKAPHVIYLVGDSTAMVYAEALADIVAKTPGWRLRVASAYGCHFATVVFQNPQTAVQNQCQAHTDDVTREIEQTKPDVLIVSHAYHPYTVLGQTKPVTPAQYAGYIRDQLRKVQPSVGKTVILAPPPGGKDPATCYRAGAPPVECVYQPPALWRAESPAMAAMARSIGASYIDSQGWFCSAAGYCPPFVAGTPVMHDETHAAPAYMDVIAPAVKEALTASSVFSR